MGSPRYGPDIRRMADEHAALTGRMPFSGVEHRGPAREVYRFDDAAFDNGPEALGYMAELLRAAREAASG